MIIDQLDAFILRNKKFQYCEHTGKLFIITAARRENETCTVAHAKRERYLELGLTNTDKFKSKGNKQENCGKK